MGLPSRWFVFAPATSATILIWEGWLYWYFCWFGWSQHSEHLRSTSLARCVLCKTWKLIAVMESMSPKQFQTLRCWRKKEKAKKEKVKSPLPWNLRLFFLKWKYYNERITKKKCCNGRGTHFPCLCSLSGFLRDRLIHKNQQFPCKGNSAKGCLLTTK